MMIYIAAAYQRKLEMRGVRVVLQGLGHQVSSSWLDQEGYGNGLGHEELQYAENVDRAREAALSDISDISRADTVINFTDGQPARGGRHVEFGLAYSWSKRLIVVGPREHVFHTLPFVDHYSSWDLLHADMITWCVDRRHLLQPES